MRVTLRVFAALLVALPATAAAETAREVGPGWTYEVRVDAQLTRADVRLCFQGFLPKRLVLPRRRAAAMLRAASGGGLASLQARADGGGYQAPGLRAGGCVGWSLDLEALTRVGGHERLASRVGGDLLVSPGALLLQPARWDARADVRVRFVLPAPLAAAAPWSATAGGYRLDRHALRLRGTIAIGRFASSRLRVAGAELEVVVLDRPLRATREGIHAWLRAAAGAVATVYGRLPCEHLLVLVEPVAAREPPVVFGVAMRGGGPHVRLLLAAAATDADLPGEWVAVHEMLHIGMPWTHEDDAWLQEGFVTYYQEVARARAGLRGEREAWQNLHEGFARGRSVGGERPLEQESAVMGREHTYWRVYWAGAALALLLDVELRTRASSSSLDAVMRRWHARHGGTRTGPARGLDLVRMADRRGPGGPCERLVRGALLRAKFPDLDALYARLGVLVRGQRVLLDDRAPQAAIRRAIMAPDADAGRQRASRNADAYTSSR